MSSSSASTDLPPVAVVGAGALGTVLARRLVDRGYPVRAVLSRRSESAQALAGRVGSAVASDRLSALPPGVRLVLLCVPDDVLPTIAGHAANIDHPWKSTVVAHTSGLRPAAVLDPLAEAGATTLSLHPLQTFAADTPPEAFEGAVVAIEGSDEAVPAGASLVRALGGRPMVLPAGAKARYHCAAALASNGLVALMGAVQEVFPTEVLDDASTSAEVLAPLIEQTWAHLEEGGAENALTGPVARGDRGTVRAHFDALDDTASHLVPLYAALSTEMVRLAVKRGDLDPESAGALLGTLREALPSSSDFSD